MIGVDGIVDKIGSLRSFPFRYKASCVQTELSSLGRVEQGNRLLAALHSELGISGMLLKEVNNPINHAYKPSSMPTS
ncbi:Hypothetical protein, putative [Bodo saltans]|uniref:Uncharacterized protein n=1 Tax=Bodo saltans TaxID=75058 RepID=A0A0S4JF17_BODSA|nr:Hypothetical protein, putative [Bodo saltans]|eukprot:CUG89055.1 Hypothetical protein, putative [Bodo saltans]